MKKLNFILLAAGLGFSSAAFAQDDDDDVHDVTIQVDEVALVDIEGPAGVNDITLGPDAPTEAGDPVDFSDQSDSTLWMNYSSIISTANNPTRDVTAKISAGTMPGGISLTVTALTYAGTGDGTLGTGAGAVTLTASDQDVVTNIGSAYTDDGVNNGHQLVYALSLTGGGGQYANLDADDQTTVSITYTISDN